MNQPTILVTGATGNIGRPLIDGLLAEGARVRALTRYLRERSGPAPDADPGRQPASKPATPGPASARARRIPGIRSFAASVNVTRGPRQTDSSSCAKVVAPALLFFCRAEVMAFSSAVPSRSSNVHPPRVVHGHRHP